MKSDNLQLSEVTISLPERPLIESLTLSIAPGEIVTLMGESGCGKSSLLAWLCGALPAAFAASGRVVIGGQDITFLPPEERRLGMLFQDDLLFPHLSVGQNLMFALPHSIRGRSERAKAVEKALEEAGLAGYEKRDPATLSGGQRARVAVMRVLLAEPRALLLDEPFAKLDTVTRQKFREFVFDHLGGRHLPTLLVTHDPADAEAAGGRTLRFSGTANRLAEKFSE
jgi:putative thiamine transport system ATP-binding protein